MSDDQNAQLRGYWAFMPRLKDLPDQVLSRVDRDADYGALQPLLRGRMAPARSQLRKPCREDLAQPGGAPAINCCLAAIAAASSQPRRTVKRRVSPGSSDCTLPLRFSAE